jgi:hypothetical protein
VKASSPAIAAVSLAAAIALFSGMARADDYGPHVLLHDLRGSAPILIAHFAPAPSLGDAVIEGDEAIVTWQSTGKPGLATFHRRNDRWWIAGVFNLFEPAVKLRPQELATRLANSPALVSRAESHVAGLDASMPIARPFEEAACARCPSRLWNFSDGFETALAFDAATPTWDPSFAIRGRAPTVAEMPPTPHMNGYFFFSIVTNGSEPVALKSSTLDVWFPYVLDAKQHYALLIGFLKPDLEDVAGTLTGNTLHFVLPAFATIPGKEALGEIDGDFN